MGNEGEGPDRYNHRVIMHESMRIWDTYDNIAYQESILIRLVSNLLRLLAYISTKTSNCAPLYRKLQKSQIKNFLKLKPEIQTTSNETI